jgi:hypothetical protein
MTNARSTACAASSWASTTYRNPRNSTAAYGPGGWAAEGDTIIRGTGREHHVVTLHERPRASLMGVHFSAPDSATVDALYAQAKAMGANVGPAPEALPAIAGGGYGFRVSTPEGHPISISSDIKLHAEAIDDRSRPTKLTTSCSTAPKSRSRRVLPRRRGFPRSVRPS